MDAIIIDERKRIKDMALKYVYSSIYLILITKANRRLTHCQIPIVAIRE